MSTAKPYKIQEADGSRRIGITAENMQDLRKKAAKRLNISDDYRLCLEDGTEITTEEYFKSLPPQTCFTFVSPDVGDLRSDLANFHKLTQKIFSRVHEKETVGRDVARELLTGDNSEMVNRVLLDYVGSLESNIHLETRGEDESWFDGLATKFQTKMEVMRAGAQTRIRNYYQKTREYVHEQDVSCNTLSLVDNFQQTLRSDEYHGDYFVRTNERNRICDELGWFKCQGKFNEDICSRSHSINPYGTKEARIIFSTWNLDHVIEKSREVLPTFVEVAENCPKDSEVNWQYFYNLLFTKKNLKMVHIACHVKGVHSGKKCNVKKFYRAKSNKTTRAKCKKTRKTRG